MSDVLAQLAEIRANTGNQQTVGLKDEIVTSFANDDPSLIRAVSEASQIHHQHPLLHHCRPQPRRRGRVPLQDPRQGRFCVSVSVCVHVSVCVCVCAFVRERERESE